MFWCYPLSSLVCYIELTTCSHPFLAISWTIKITWVCEWYRGPKPFLESLHPSKYLQNSPDNLTSLSASISEWVTDGIILTKTEILNMTSRNLHLFWRQLPPWPHSLQQPCVLHLPTQQTKVNKVFTTSLVFCVHSSVLLLSFCLLKGISYQM